MTNILRILFCPNAANRLIGPARLSRYVISMINRIIMSASLSDDKSKKLVLSNKRLLESGRLEKRPDPKEDPRRFQSEFINRTLHSNYDFLTAYRGQLPLGNSK